MKVPEATIVRVITEASPHMSDSKYITARVERLMRAQPSVCQYLMSFQKELGVEGSVSVLFFAALVEDAVTAASGRGPARVGYPDLDLAANTIHNLEELAASEPELASFIASNVDLGSGGSTPTAQRALAHVAQALVTK
jgi:hypothetical protein